MMNPQLPSYSTTPAYGLSKAPAMNPLDPKGIPSPEEMAPALFNYGKFLDGGASSDSSRKSWMPSASEAASHAAPNYTAISQQLTHTSPEAATSAYKPTSDAFYTQANSSPSATVAAKPGSGTQEQKPGAAYSNGNSASEQLNSGKLTPSTNGRSSSQPNSFSPNVQGQQAVDGSGSGANNTALPARNGQNASAQNGVSTQVQPGQAGYTQSGPSDAEQGRNGQPQGTAHDPQNPQQQVIGGPEQSSMPSANGSQPSPAQQANTQGLPGQNSTKPNGAFQQPNSQNGMPSQSQAGQGQQAQPGDSSSAGNGQKPVTTNQPTKNSQANGQPQASNQVMGGPEQAPLSPEDSQRQQSPAGTASSSTNGQQTASSQQGMAQGNGPSQPNAAQNQGQQPSPNQASQSNGQPGTPNNGSNGQAAPSPNPAQNGQSQQTNGQNGQLKRPQEVLGGPEQAPISPYGPQEQQMQPGQNGAANGAQPVPNAQNGQDQPAAGADGKQQQQPTQNNQGQSQNNGQAVGPDGKPQDPNAQNAQGQKGNGQEGGPDGKPKQPGDQTAQGQQAKGPDGKPKQPDDGKLKVGPDGKPLPPDDKGNAKKPGEGDAAKPKEPDKEGDEKKPPGEEGSKGAEDGKADLDSKGKLSKDTIIDLNNKLNDSSEQRRKDASAELVNIFQAHPEWVKDPTIKPTMDAFLVKVLNDPNEIVRIGAELYLQTGLEKNPSPKVLSSLKRLSHSDNSLTGESDIATGLLQSLSKSDGVANRVSSSLQSPFKRDR